MSIRLRSFPLVLAAAGLVMTLLAGAAKAAPSPHHIVTGWGAGWPEVRTWTATGARSRMWARDGNAWPLQFAAYPTHEKGVRVAVADVTGDGRAEIVAAPGSDAWTSIELFDGRTYGRLSSLPPWPKGSWWNGAYVAAADATGDGRAEIVVGLGPGCCTSLHVWDVLAGSRIGETFPFGARSEEGALVAAGDVSGDGRAEVLAAPHFGGRVSVFPASGGAAFRSFVAFDPPGALRAIAAGDLAGDARVELVAGGLGATGAQIKVLDAGTGATLASLFPFGSDIVTAIAVAVGDLDGDGSREVIAAATTPEGTRVRAIGLDGTSVASFYALEPGLAPGVSLAAGDVDGDGKAEIVLGSGPTTAPPAPAHGPAQVIAVFDRTGRALGRFAAFAGRFQGAVHIASGDLTGSPRPEIVTAPGEGIPAEIGIYDDEWRPDRERGNRLASFLAFEPTFLGGASIALGDLAGDSRAEIVAGTGPGRVAEVRVFDPRGSRLSAFVAFGEQYKGGIAVAAGDLDADGRAEVVASTLEPPARIRIFGSGGEARALLLPATDGAAVEIAVADLDGDGRGEIVTGRVAGGEPLLEVLDTVGSRLRGTLAYDAAFAGGIHVAAGDLDADGRDEIVVGPGDAGGGEVRVYDRRLAHLRSFTAYPWDWPGVFVAVRRATGLPLVALPRTVRVATGARRTFVVASFRDVARSRELFHATIRWSDEVSTKAVVRARGGGLYDVLATRRFARAQRYAAAVTFRAGRPDRGRQEHRGRPAA